MHRSWVSTRWITGSGSGGQRRRRHSLAAHRPRKPGSRQTTSNEAPRNNNSQVLHVLLCIALADGACRLLLRPPGPGPGDAAAALEACVGVRLPPTGPLPPGACGTGCYGPGLATTALAGTGHCACPRAWQAAAPLRPARAALSGWALLTWCDTVAATAGAAAPRGPGPSHVFVCTCPARCWCRS